ncbi:MAG: PD40 domain-containing protein [Flavobacteriales bacterium]|nr:PD40 domain-containing protein [Flavobacteriales bacterium]
MTNTSSSSLKPLLLALLVFLLQNPYAQTIQWASKVKACSSEFKDKDKSLRYRAVQVLDQPNVLPQGGESPCAWSPKKKSKIGKEWIHVAFVNPMQIKQVAIAESYNCGTIVCVKLIDEEGKYHKIKTFTQAKTGETSRMYNVYMPLTEYKVKEVIVCLKTSLIKGWNHIDAIGISDSNEPIKAKINNAPEKENIALEILSTNVNSEYSDLKPIISPDGKTLYFVRKEHPDNIGPEKKDDIWVSDFGPNGWELAYQLPAPLNNNGHNYVNGVSADGSKVLLGNIYGSNTNKGIGMSASNFDGEKWSFPYTLNITNYYNFSEFMEAHVTSDFKVIVMSVWRKDTYGAKDLYVSFDRGGNNWSQPLNLGRTINTASTEMAPFLAADGKTLYFASTGFSGYGGYDMYMSQRLDDTWQNWSKPLNMGPVINSNGHDTYLSLDANGEYAFLSRSSQASDSRADIYKIKLAEETRPEKMQVIEILLDGIEDHEHALLTYSKIDDPNSKTSVYSLLGKEDQVFRITTQMSGFYQIKIELEGYQSIEMEMGVSNYQPLTLKMEKNP